MKAVAFSEMLGPIHKPNSNNKAINLSVTAVRTSNLSLGDVVHPENVHCLFNFFRAALVLRGDCAHINIRCAQGFCKLPYPYKAIQLAKECCDKALLLAPNNAMANHVAGLICEWYEADSEEAKKYYKRAGEQGSYGAFMDLYRLKYNEVIIVSCKTIKPHLYGGLVGCQSYVWVSLYTPPPPRRALVQSLARKRYVFMFDPHSINLETTRFPCWTPQGHNKAQRIRSVEKSNDIGTEPIFPTHSIHIYKPIWI
jgi:tetratricopeptide (TPR) repeat protein